MCTKILAHEKAIIQLEMLMCLIYRAFQFKDGI